MADLPLPKFDGTCELSKDTDVLLRFDCGTKLHAHSLILKKGSGVLKNALELNHEKGIPINGSDPDTWRLILASLYSSWTTPLEIEKVPQDLIEKALVQCEKYNIPRVKDQCERQLVGLVGTARAQNLCRWLKLSRQASSPSLARACSARIAERVTSQASPRTIRFVHPPITHVDYSQEVAEFVEDEMSATLTTH